MGASANTAGVIAPGAPAGIPAAILALAAGGPVFTPDKYVEDPSHLGYVLRFVDWNDPTHWLVQTDTAKQVPLPATHADFANKKCAVHTGVEWYDSNRAASAWKFLHDGTGEWLTSVLTPTASTPAGSYFSTTLDAASTGFQCVHTTTPAIFAQALNGAAFPVSASRTPPSFVNVPRLIDFNYKEGSSPEYRLNTTGVAAVTGNSASAPDTGNPTATFRLGARPNGLVPAKFRWAFLMTAPKEPSAGDRTAMLAFLLSRYGVAP